MTREYPWKPPNKKKKLYRNQGNVCKEPGCKMMARCKGYCSKHYEFHNRKKGI